MLFLIWSSVKICLEFSNDLVQISISNQTSADLSLTAMSVLCETYFDQKNSHKIRTRKYCHGANIKLASFGLPTQNMKLVICLANNDG